MSKYIELYGGNQAIVDDEDYEEFSKYKWHMSKVGYPARSVWLPSQKNRDYFMHSFLLEKKNGYVSDHVNGNKLDNRKENLRYATRSENQCNQRKRKNSSSKYKGVSYNKAMKSWEANIQKSNIAYQLGYYKIEEEAAIAYNYKAIELHGEFARLNVIGGIL